MIFCYFAGGIFDPFGLSKGSTAELKLKEIKNGRLAMLAFAGFAAQARTTGESPLDNLATHLADPWGQNVLTSKTASPELWTLFLHLYKACSSENASSTRSFRSVSSPDSLSLCRGYCAPVRLQNMSASRIHRHWLDSRRSHVLY